MPFWTQKDLPLVPLHLLFKVSRHTPKGNSDKACSRQGVNWDKLGDTPSYITLGENSASTTATVEILNIKREVLAIKTKKLIMCQKTVLYKDKQIAPIQNGMHI